jgi:hypothetical protein
MITDSLANASASEIDCQIDAARALADVNARRGTVEAVIAKQRSRIRGITPETDEKRERDAA